MGDTTRTIYVQAEVEVEVWSDCETEAELDSYLRAQPTELKKAISRLLECHREIDAGWVDNDHEAVVVESTSAIVAKIEEPYDAHAIGRDLGKQLENEGKEQIKDAIETVSAASEELRLERAEHRQAEGNK